MRTRNEELFAKKRDEILKAAVVCFSENGFHQTSMQKICTASNMSPGGLYRYFGSKTEIIQAIAETGRAQMDALIPATDKKKNPEKVISAVLLAAIDHAEKSEGAALEAEILSEALRNEGVAKSLENNQQGLRKFLEQTIRKGKKQKKVSKGVKTQSVVAFLLSYIQSLSLQASTQPTFEASKLRPHVRVLVRSLLQPDTDKS